ncbi:MAG: type II toxin-antitoxin system MqsA family antitoxin [Enterobacterales bacterium]|nr:type II toxin-antitoxin system MqsA family antitoxin [Enterobacterales bacterium]
MTNLNELCPVCGEGRLSEQAGQNSVQYKGVEENIPLYFSVCDYCEMEQGDAIQTRQNKREMIAFKKRIDGLLSGNEIKKFRNVYGVTQAEVSEILGGGPVAFSKYEKNDVSQSGSMDNLIRVCKEFPEVFEWLAARANVEINEVKAMEIC